MTRFVTEPERRLDISQSAEVLIVGGGIAGISAAIAAARGGRKVTLIEREYCLGGMATLGLVTIYLPLDDGLGNQVIFGIGEELLRLSIKHGAEANYPRAWIEGGTIEEKKKHRYVTQFNPHIFALEAEKLLCGLGVNILYGTLAASAVMEGDKISGIVIENKSGRSVIECSCVIDCSGDADIAWLSGAGTALHEGGNGLASWYYYKKDGDVRLKMFGLADLPPSENPQEKKDDPYGNATVASLTNTRFSGVDGPELSRAVIEAHGKMFEDILEHKETDPEYVPVTISTIPLVRMSRRLCGEYTLDESENRVAFSDSIGLTGDWRRPGPCFEIPYRTLYTNKVRNLLCAGRTISVTDDMWDITRVIPGCAVTGEAAGTAAALTYDFPSLDVDSLQAKLREGGVKIHI